MQKLGGEQIEQTGAFMYFVQVPRDGAHHLRTAVRHHKPREEWPDALYLDFQTMPFRICYRLTNSTKAQLVVVTRLHYFLQVLSRRLPRFDLNLVNLSRSWVHCQICFSILRLLDPSTLQGDFSRICPEVPFQNTRLIRTERRRCRGRASKPQ